MLITLRESAERRVWQLKLLRRANAFVRLLSTMAASPPPPSGIRLARRLEKFAGETVWQEFTPLAREMGAVNLGQGFPDWPSPDFVKNAMKRAQDDNANQYCRSAGHVPLVQALAKRCVFALLL